MAWLRVNLFHIFTKFLLQFFTILLEKINGGVLAPSFHTNEPKYARPLVLDLIFVPISFFLWGVFYYST